VTQWIEKVRLSDCFHDDGMPFPQRRDEIVRRIKQTKWFKRADEADTDLHPLIEKLADTHDVDEFDQVWDLIYDIADADRVWIETIA
jgi:hypothetical protein